MGAADIKKPVDGPEFKAEQARPTSTGSSTSTVEDYNSPRRPEEDEIEMDLCKTHEQVDGSDAKKEEKDEQKDHGVNGEDDENDGFRTPTGPEHRIPATTVCPGAPKVRRFDRRPAVVIRKIRKASASLCRRRLAFEVDDYLNLVFHQRASSADSDKALCNKERTS